MPYTMNGIGTWYYGKTNIHTRHDTCEHCGRTWDLRSYDTMNYFVLLFIPILPLGRKRIIDECPSCFRHRALGLKQWEKIKADSLKEALEACQKEPNNAEAVEKALGATIAFQDEAAFNRIVNTLAPQLKNNAGLLALLGSGLEFFARVEKAEKVFRAALELKDNVENREALAINLLRQSRPDEARPLLQHIFDDALTEKMGLPILVVAGYQATGQHDKALSLLNDSLEAFPQLEQDRDYNKLRRISEKQRTTGTRITTQGLTLSAGAPTQKRPWAVTGARLALPALLGLITIAYLLIAHAHGRAREIYLVNGLSRAYTVDINGTQRVLRPMGFANFTLPEGEITVKVLAGGPAIEDQTCRIETDFFSRPFSDDVFVINPDRAAILVWEETIYSEYQSADTTNPFHIHTGQLLHTFSDVDYTFQAFPPEISMSSGASDVKKCRIDLVRELGFREAISVIATYLNMEAVVSYVMRLALYEPDHEEYVGVLMNLIEPGEVVSLLRPRLATRPVEVELHRIYQICVDRAEPNHDLDSEYRAYLKDDPDDPTLMYLLGRILDDEAESERLFQKAARADPPSVRAIGAMAYDRLTKARFDEALGLTRRAVVLSPNQPSFMYVENEALEALGRYDEALTLLRQGKLDTWIDRNAVDNELYLLMRLGRTNEAEELIDQFNQRIAQTVDENERFAVNEYLHAIQRYIAGDAGAFANLDASTHNSIVKFQILLSAGKLEEAEQLIEAGPSDTSNAYLLLYLVGHVEEKRDSAERYLARAVEKLRTLGKMERRLARWLTGEEQPDDAAILNMNMIPAEKKIVLTAVGLVLPKHRVPCFDLARRLNYETRFPHLLLKEILDSK